MDNILFVDLCKRQVVQYFRNKKHEYLTDSDVDVVRLTKVLQNNKALLSSIYNDGMYFEITYDGDKDKLYIDAYQKENTMEVEL